MLKNKKGMLDDLFDFLFTVMAAFFLLMFVNIIFDSNIEDSRISTLSLLNHFEQNNTRLGNLKISTFLNLDFKINDLDALYKEGYYYNGKIIYNCTNYENKLECMKDGAELWRYNTYKCSWNEEFNSCLSIKIIKKEIN